MMKYLLITLIVLGWLGSLSAQLPKPTKEQVEWADCEIGAIIHFDINVYEPEYEWRGQWDYNPDPKIFNPEELDTDQWVKAVKDMGGEYAVLVVKHCTGFCLWPTEAHEYSIKSSPWKNGQGDILAEFIQSCKKYDVRPGVYYSAAANGYKKVDNPGLVRGNDPVAQKEYNAMVEQQLTEIYSQYGKFFEIWFDGGCLAPEKGGPDIVTLLHKYQSQAVVFQGPEGTNSLIRWVGNERGVAPYPCWSTTHTGTSSGGDVEIDRLHGSADGPLWCPGEADFPIRHGGWQGGWFYHSENTKHLMSLETLIDKYNTTAGRNTNMLIGVVVDPRGLVPEVDVKRMKEFGDEIKKRFNHPIAQTKGKGNDLALSFHGAQAINHVVLMEDISKGERVRKFEILGKKAGSWISLGEGSCIGHKYIHQFDRMELSAVKLVVKESVEKPMIRDFSVYNIQ
ncbi:alpha-L-fucosidase [Sunxiuqinia sp. sy24]|uniref:alpha-L-fucosidase n=1 Tax=Sunxiuqinia sp. sy24 TaxID=3461495 RepID=UPI00404615BD